MAGGSEAPRSSPSPKQRQPRFAAVRRMGAGLSGLPPILDVRDDCPPESLDSFRQAILDHLSMALSLAKAKRLSTELTGFVCDVFSQPVVLQAYLYPQMPGGIPDREPRQLTPMQDTLHAVHRVVAHENLIPWEKEVAAVATLVNPVGLFVLAHPELLSHAGITTHPLPPARAVRDAYLQMPLRRLRTQSNFFGQRMTAALGIPEPQSSNAEKALDREAASRLETAVFLASIRVVERWAPWVVVQGQRSQAAASRQGPKA